MQATSVDDILFYMLALRIQQQQRQPYQKHYPKRKKKLILNSF